MLAFAAWTRYILWFGSYPSAPLSSVILILTFIEAYPPNLIFTSEIIVHLSKNVHPNQL